MTSGGLLSLSYLGEYYCVMSHHLKKNGKLKHFSGVIIGHQPKQGTTVDGRNPAPPGMYKTL